MKKLFRFGLLVLGAYVLTVASVYLFQKNIVFRPAPLAKDYTYELGYPCKEFFLQTPSGDSINALWLPASTDSSRGAILYLHGNADNLSRWAGYHEDFTSRGYDFLAIDYRGYGKSSGKPNEQRMYEDAAIAYDWMRQQYEPEAITLYGRSLGTGVSSHLARNVEAKRLVLETPYDNIRSAIQKSIPLLWLPFPLKYKFPNNEYLPEVDMPTYIFHGTKDAVVPYASAAMLKPLLPEKDHFITIRGGKHRNLSEFELFQDKLDEILGKSF
jgi:fermentation-respiration switch protein FrsA (DUF1100 family)